MKKIKVLYIIDYLLTGGGTENQLRQMIANLDRSRFEPYLITLSIPEMYKDVPSDISNCHHIDLNVPKLKSLRALGAVLKIARFIRREQIDIVQTFFIDANIIGVLAGFLARCRCIIVSRRDLGYWYTPRLLSLFRKLNRLAHAYMVNSEAIKRIVIERESVDPDKVVVIHNGHFDIPSDEASKLSKSDLQIPNDAPVVGLVANLRPVKRIDNFIKVASRVKRQDTHFVVMGAGSLKEELQRLAADAGLADRFHIAHTVDSIHEYIKLFDVGVLTSDSEGLSNTLIEYLLCGVSAVAFDVGGNREVIEDGKSGYLIPAGEIDLMRSRIESLLTDSNLRNQMGKQGRKDALVRFSGERALREITQFYQSSLECAKQ